MAPGASLAEMTRDLVRIPSRAGADPQGPVLEAIAHWLSARRIDYEILNDEKHEPLAIYAEIAGRSPGPAYLLNAPADTAPTGDPLAWRHEAFGAAVVDGWLYGRGSADSKAGIAVYCHVAEEWKRSAGQTRGTLILAFDAEEHSGTFRGIRRCVEHRLARGRIDGAMIGYPGQDRIVTGCRGFLRAVLSVHGLSAHSGSSRRTSLSPRGWRAAAPSHSSPPSRCC
jgi:succinyl-diaminopimelate desuccinylase